MASEPCDACGDDVPIGGGIAAIWSMDPQGTDGMTMELADGTEHFLCFDCIAALPDDPTDADVAGLSKPDSDSESSTDPDS